MDSMVERIGRLERGARRWRLGAFALGLAVGAVGTVGAVSMHQADTVQARRFEVVNDAGVAMGRFGYEAGSNRIPELIINYGEDRPAAYLTHDGEIPTLILYPAGGKGRVVLGIDKGGGGYGDFVDAKGGRSRVPRQ